MVTSKQFYTKLTPEGLSKRKEEVHTNKELSFLKKRLSKKENILDLGCGYGRLTIPLAKEGYKIAGVDITPAFIKKARKEAKINNLPIKFKIGDMRKLPYKEESFDTIVLQLNFSVENRKI